MKPHWCILHPPERIASATVEIVQKGRLQASIETAYIPEEAAVDPSALSAFGNLVFFLAVKWNVILHLVQDKYT